MEKCNPNNKTVGNCNSTNDDNILNSIKKIQEVIEVVNEDETFDNKECEEGTIFNKSRSNYKEEVPMKNCERNKNEMNVLKSEKETNNIDEKKVNSKNTFEYKNILNNKYDKYDNDNDNNNKEVLHSTYLEYFDNKNKECRIENKNNNVNNFSSEHDIPEDKLDNNKSNNIENKKKRTNCVANKLHKKFGGSKRFAGDKCAIYSETKNFKKQEKREAINFDDLSNDNELGESSEASEFMKKEEPPKAGTNNNSLGPSPSNDTFLSKEKPPVIQVSPPKSQSNEILRELSLNTHQLEEEAVLNKSVNIHKNLRPSDLSPDICESLELKLSSKDLVSRLMKKRNADWGSIKALDSSKVNANIFGDTLSPIGNEKRKRKLCRVRKA
jgi:hypothetical protein